MYHVFRSVSGNFNENKLPNRISLPQCKLHTSTRIENLNGRVQHVGTPFCLNLKREKRVSVVKLKMTKIVNYGVSNELIVVSFGPD